MPANKPTITPVDPGRLRHLVTINNPARFTQDNFGVRTPVPSLVGNVRAAIEPLSGQELLTLRGLEGVETNKITIRYIDGVTLSSTVTFGTKTYKIFSTTNPQERNRYLILMCYYGQQ